jgi:hypothetical protein
MSKGPKDPKDPKVGYGRPPTHSQFKPGQSGNPKGRPKGTRKLASVVRAAMTERVTIVQNGKRKSISKLDAAMIQAANQAAGGDHRAMRMLFDLVRGIEMAEAPHAHDNPKTIAELKAADAIILEATARMLNSAVSEDGGDD